MKKSAWMVAVIALIAGAACAKKSPPRPPAAPAIPPPAPAPEDSSVDPQKLGEYEALRGLSPEEIDRMGLLQEIHFDYDRSDIREEDLPLLVRNSDVLKRFDFLHITVEGHCDERGTVEYNLALGERRARAVHDYLLSLGVGANRMRAASYGKESPLCTESTASCWARNRRAAPRVTGKAPE